MVSNLEKMASNLIVEEHSIKASIHARRISSHLRDEAVVRLSAKRL